ASARLRPESNLVVHADRHHRCRRVRCDDQFQSVGQRRALNRNVQSLHACPPVAFAFDFLFTATFSNSSSMAAESCARTSAARAFTASYVCPNSAGKPFIASACAATTP